MWNADNLRYSFVQKIFFLKKGAIGKKNVKGYLISINSGLIHQAYFQEKLGVAVENHEVLQRCVVRTLRRDTQ